MMPPNKTIIGILFNSATIGISTTSIFSIAVQYLSYGSEALITKQNSPSSSSVAFVIIPSESILKLVVSLIHHCSIPDSSVALAS